MIRYTDINWPLRQHILVILNPFIFTWALTSNLAILFINIDKITKSLGSLPFSAALVVEHGISIGVVLINLIFTVIQILRKWCWINLQISITCVRAKNRWPHLIFLEANYFAWFIAEHIIRFRKIHCNLCIILGRNEIFFWAFTAKIPAIVA